MSKKNKQKLQAQLLKKQRLQRLEQGLGTVVNFASSAQVVTAKQAVSEVIIKPAEAVVTDKSPAVAGLTRTAICLAAIAIIFLAAVIVKNQTDLDTQFGSWLYTALRLSS